MKAKKSLGQNFLVDDSAIKKIIQAAAIKKGEHVLEIGPGKGVLTQALVDAGARVTAVEIDADLILLLKETFGDQIQLIEGDILEMDATGLFGKKTYKVIANIPYYITSPILEKFLAHEPRPKCLVMMVQKEVADRITAKPPQMSLLSVVCQMYADVSKVSVVKAGAFRPIPKVDSAIVKLVLKKKTDVLQAERVIALAKIGFAAKRKQLHNNLSSGLSKPTELIKQAIVSAGLQPNVRAENLTVSDWERLEKCIRV